MPTRTSCTADGTWTAPRLKPDFSPEFLLTSAYIGRPLAMGADVADHLPRLVAADTAALEHECALAATEIADGRPHPRGAVPPARRRPDDAVGIPVGPPC